MPNESGERWREGREGGAEEEIGRSGYYHGTPLFPPPPSTATDPLGGRATRARAGQSQGDV